MSDDTLYLTDLAEFPRGRHRYKRETREILESTCKWFFITFLVLAITTGYFLLYEIYGKTHQINSQQGNLKEQLQTEWNITVPTPNVPKPIPGGAIALLNIPTINKSLAVVEGVELNQIENAPGHYPDSAMPGQKGNFAMAGHRSEAIFRHIDRVKAGDLITVETKTRIYTYKVTDNFITKPTALYVVNPVPPGFKKGQNILTITTCSPWWDNYERLIIHAVLTKSEKRSA